MTKQQKARAIFGLMILGNILVFLMLWFVGLPLVDRVFAIIASYGTGPDFAPYMRGMVVGLTVAVCVVFSFIQLKRVKRVISGMPQPGSQG